MKIHVTVLLHAIFREIVGKREIVEEVKPNSTLNNVLDHLASKYGREFAQLVDPETGTVSLESIVSINGRITRDTKVRLKNDDIIMITIPVGGG